MKNNNKSKVSQRNKPSKPNNSRLDNTGTIVPLRLQDIMPPKIIRTLNYIDAAYVRNNPGNNFLVYSFRVNDLFDPDPLILSGSVSGFKEIMNFYSAYRVKSVHVQFKIFNNEAFALLYGCVFSQTNLTISLGTRDDAINALENDFSTRARLISAKGGLDSDCITYTLEIWKLLGNKQQYEADINYAGLGVVSPTTPLWLNFIVASPTGAALANGYTNATTISMTSEFFGRTNLRA